MLSEVQASNPPDLPQGPYSASAFLTPLERNLSLDVLIFGTFVLILLYILLRSKRASSDDILKPFCVTLVIVGSMFLVTAGFSSQQIAPAFGLFGTVVGYVIGHRGNTSKTQSKLPEEQVVKNV
jgi:hypothetical protein